MLCEGDELDARQRWTSSLMNLQSSSSASAAGHSANIHLYDHAAYQPSMTTYTDCSRSIADLAGYTSVAAGFTGYQYMTGSSRYNTVGGLQASTDRFRLQHDVWGESISGSGTSHGNVPRGTY